MSYNSKYTGAEVEALLDKVNEGNFYDATDAYKAARDGTMTDSQFEELANCTYMTFISPSGDYSDLLFVSKCLVISEQTPIVKLVAVSDSADGIVVTIYAFNGDTLTVEVSQDFIENKYTSVTSSTGSVELSDTKMYILGEQSAVTITLPSGAESNGREYLCQFTAASSGCTLSVPDTITWLGGETPTINAGKTYQLSILNNLAVIGEF